MLSLRSSPLPPLPPPPPPPPSPSPLPALLVAVDVDGVCGVVGEPLDFRGDDGGKGVFDDGEVRVGDLEVGDLGDLGDLGEWGDRPAASRRPSADDSERLRRKVGLGEPSPLAREGEGGGEAALRPPRWGDCGERRRIEVDVEIDSNCDVERVRLCPFDRFPFVCADELGADWP